MCPLILELFGNFVQARGHRLMSAGQYLHPRVELSLFLIPGDTLMQLSAPPCFHHQFSSAENFRAFVSTDPLLNKGMCTNTSHQPSAIRHRLLSVAPIDCANILLSKEWVSNCWWGWQNRTALEKCTNLYNETQGTIKHKRFRQIVFVGCKKRENSKRRRK